MRKQSVALENGIDVAPVRRQALSWSGEPRSVEPNFALVGILEASHQPQSRGFAATRWSKQRKKRAARNGERDIRYGLMRAKGFADAPSSRMQSSAMKP